MPCRDDGYPDSECVKNFNAVLCGVFTLAEKDGTLEKLLNSLNWREIGHTRAEVEAWWNRHKEEDSKRRQQELKEAQRRIARAQGELDKAQREYDQLLRR